MAAVVEMGVGENNGINTAGLDRESLPILQAQCLEALRQAAVHEQPLPFTLDEIFRPGNRTATAEKVEVQAHAGAFSISGSQIRLACRFVGCLIQVNIRAGKRD